MFKNTIKKLENECDIIQAQIEKMSKELLKNDYKKPKINLKEIQKELDINKKENKELLEKLNKNIKEKIILENLIHSTETQDYVSAYNRNIYDKIRILKDKFIQIQKDILIKIVF